jgi:HEAT repeat protein
VNCAVQNRFLLSPVRYGYVGAGYMLKKMGPAEDQISSLISNLKHSRQSVRRKSAFILGEIGPKARPAIPALAEALDDPKSSVRRIANAALRKLKLEIDQETEAKTYVP